MQNIVPFRVICDPGLEDVCANEIDALLSAQESPAPAVPGPARSGLVRVSMKTEHAHLLSQLRTIYHIVMDLGEISAGVHHLISSLCSWAETAEIPGLSTAESFRVTTDRQGDHPFQSEDVNREVGRILFSRTPAGVNLDAPDLNLRIDIRNETAYIGLQQTTEPLDKRYKWLFRPRVTLRTTISAAMLQLGRKHLLDAAEPLTVVDPFCGSGTILLEAARIFPEARIVGGDINGKAVAGTLENAVAANLAPLLDVRQWDAAHLSEELPAGCADLVITNPPYGLRMGARLNFRAFYEHLLTEAAHVLHPGGCMVLLVGKKRGLFNYVLREHPEWKQIDVRVIEIGGSYPGLFVVQRQRQ